MKEIQANQNIIPQNFEKIFGKEEFNLFVDLETSKESLLEIISLSKFFINDLIHTHGLNKKDYNVIVNLEKIRIKLNKTKSSEKRNYILSHVSKYISENKELFQKIDISKICSTLLKNKPTQNIQSVKSNGFKLEILNKYFSKISIQHNIYNNCISKLCQMNKRLVIHLAKKQQNLYRKVEIQDLIQEGNIGLLKAISKFNIHRMNKFSTYASYLINRQMQKFIQKSTLIKIPEGQQLTISKINKLENNREKRLSSKEIENSLGVSTKTSKVLENINTVTNIISLDQEFDDSEMTMKDLLKSSDILPSQNIDDNIIISKVKSILINNKISERDIEIFLLRYGLLGNYEYPLTLSQIMNMYNISKERVRQVIKRCLTLLSAPNNINILKNI